MSCKNNIAKSKYIGICAVCGKLTSFRTASPIQTFCCSDECSIEVDKRWGKVVEHFANMPLLFKSWKQSETYEYERLPKIDKWYIIIKEENGQVIPILCGKGGIIVDSRVVSIEREYTPISKYSEFSITKATTENGSEYELLDMDLGWRESISSGGGQGDWDGFGLPKGIANALNIKTKDLPEDDKNNLQKM